MQYGISDDSPSFSTSNDSNNLVTLVTLTKYAEFTCGTTYDSIAALRPWCVFVAACSLRNLDARAKSDTY